MDDDKRNQINYEFLKAVRDNEMREVKRLLELGADVNTEHYLKTESVYKNRYDDFDERFKPYTPLRLAAEKGYVEIVEELLRFPELDVNEKDKDYGWSALHLASEKGHVKIVRRLLDVKDIDVNIAINRKCVWTPLIMASQRNQAEVVKALLDNSGIEINKTDASGETALHRAAYSGYEETARILLEDHRISVNIKDSLYCRTALHIAADQHHEEVVRLLLNHKDIDVNLQDKDGQTALHTSAHHGDEGVVEMLLEACIDVDAKTAKGFTALQMAGKQKHGAVVKMITEHIQLRKILGPHQRTKSIQANEESIGFYDILPVNDDLLQAAKRGDSEKVKYLLKQPGIEVNSVDRNKNTPLQLAAEKGHAEVVKVLLETEDIDVNAKNIDKSKMFYPPNTRYDPTRKEVTTGKAALQLAVKNGHFEVVKLLVNFKETDVNTEDKCGRSCIYLAVREGYIGITKLLLNHIKTNPNVQLPCNDHFSPLHTALENNNMEMVRALLNHPDIDLNIKETCDGLTPFHMAVKMDFLPVVETMLQYPETDVNTVNKWNETPLYTCAVEKSNISMVEMLLKSGKMLCFHELFKKITSPSIIRMIADYVKGNIKTDDITHNSKNEDLLKASQKGNSERFLELSKLSGVDINCRDRNGNTCLHLAADRGHVEIVRELLKMPDIEVNAKNRDDSKYIYPVHSEDDTNRREVTDGKTPLFYAVKRGHLEIVKFLVSHYKIDVNATDKYDQSCLHLAASKGYKKIAQALLRHPKINVNGKYTCYDHFTPLHMAVEKNRSAVVEVLLSHPNTDVNGKDRLYENTPLHMAANYGYWDILEPILSHPKINVNIKNKAGKTALQLAVQNKHEFCIHVLLNTRLPV